MSMSRRRLLSLAVGLVAVLAISHFVVAGKLPADVGEPKAESKTPTGKGKRAQEFIAAFNKGDAKAVAGFWVPDGNYVDQAGREYKGRAALEKLYDKVFAAGK